MTKEIEGQITLLDFFGTTEPEKEPLNLLSMGQTVFLVKGCTVEEYTVASPYIVQGETFYHLDKEDGSHGTTRDSYVGKNTFVDKQQMEHAVITYVRNHPQVLMPETIRKKVNSIMGYTRKREEDGRVITSVCAILDDNSVYLKDWSIYTHIIKFDSFEKALMYRRQWIKRNEDEEELTDFTNVFKPMYPCNKDCRWDYAEAKYIGSIV